MNCLHLHLWGPCRSQSVLTLWLAEVGWMDMVGWMDGWMETKMARKWGCFVFLNPSHTWRFGGSSKLVSIVSIASIVNRFLKTQAILGGRINYRPFAIFWLPKHSMGLVYLFFSVSKWLVNPSYKAFRPIGRGTTPVRGLSLVYVFRVQSYFLSFGGRGYLGNT